MKKFITAVMTAIIAAGAFTTGVFADDSKYIQTALEKVEKDFVGLPDWGAYDNEGEPMRILYRENTDIVDETDDYCLVAVTTNGAVALICLVDKHTNTCVYTQSTQDYWPGIINDNILPRYKNLPFRIVIDGRELLSYDAGYQGYIENGTTMLPLRTIFERLDAEVEWHEKTKSITAHKDGTDINMQVGSRNATVNGKNVTLAAAPVIKDYYTYVPARFVSESLGADVKWDAATKTVTINS